MVLASKPVASLMRLAARPVGAQRSSFTLFAESTRSIELTIVVLPTPGPPVMTSTLETSARRIAVFWLSASCSPMRCSNQGRAYQLRRYLKQVLGERNQLFGRQSAMSLVHGLGQGEGDARAHPDNGTLLDAEFHGDRVGGLKADAADVARQPVGVLRHDLHRVGTIRLVDTHRPRRADTVLM